MAESAQNVRPLSDRLHELEERAKRVGHLTWDDIHELLPTPLGKGELELIMCRLAELSVRIYRSDEIRKPWAEVVSPELLAEQDKRYDAVDARIRACIPGKQVVKYSVFEWDHQYMPIDILDRAAEHGKLYFEEDPTQDQEFPREIWRSPVVENPTWLQLTILCNDMMLTCGYEDYPYFEGIYEIGEEADGTRRMGFIIGS